MKKQLLLGALLGCMSVGISLQAMEVDIWDAIEKKNVAKVKQYISAGGDVSFKKDDGTSLLHAAAYHNNLAAARLLIENGATTINTQDGNGYVPLHEAVEKKYLEFIKFLIENKANVNIQSNMGNTPLHIAAYNNNLIIAKFLLQNGANVNIKNKNNETPFNSAKTDEMRQLLSKTPEELMLMSPQEALGVPDNAEPHQILGVAENASQETIKKAYRALVLKWHPDKHENKNLANEVMKLLNNAKNKLLEAMSETAKTTWETVIFKAAEKDNVVLVQQYINKGGDVNAQDKNRLNKSLLHLAAENNALGVVRLLIAKKADVNGQDRFGNAPLHWAAFHNNNLEAASLLVENGADVNARNNLNNTPLHRTAINNALAIASLLIKKKADVNAQNKFGDTPLHIIAENDYSLGVARLLIRNGANVGIKNKENKTAFEIAITDEMRQLLLKTPEEILMLMSPQEALGVPDNATSYQILGVTGNASRETIRNAHRDLIRKWHPDKHKNKELANEVTQLLNNARDKLLGN